MSITTPAPITFGPPVVTAVPGATAPLYPTTAAGDGTGLVVATADTFDAAAPAALQLLTPAGGGTFASARSFASTTDTAGPFPFVAGDYTYGGTEVDLTFARTGSPGSIGLLTTVGAAAGGFASASDTDLAFGADTAARQVTAGAAADLDGDGSVDLAVVAGVIGGPEQLLVLPTGTDQAIVSTPLTATVTAATIAAPQSLTVADLNGDGIPDLVWYDGAAVHPLFGTGTGTFTAGPIVPAAGDYVAVAPLAGGSAAVDDVVVVARTPATYRVLRNDGSGTFADDGAVSLGDATVTAAVAADLNEDGYPDLDVGSAALAGRGDGTFAAPTPHATLDDATGLAAARLVVADQTGDGLPDLAGYAAGGAGVETLPNTTGVTARAATTVTLTTPRTTVRLGDLVTVTALLSAADPAAAPAAVPTGNVAFSVDGSAAQNALVEDGSTFFGQQLPVVPHDVGKAFWPPLGGTAAVSSSCWCSAQICRPSSSSWTGPVTYRSTVHAPAARPAAAAGVVPVGSDPCGRHQLYTSRHSDSDDRRGVRRRLTSRVRRASRPTHPRQVPFSRSTCDVFTSVPSPSRRTVARTSRSRPNRAWRRTRNTWPRASAILFTTPTRRPGGGLRRGSLGRPRPPLRRPWRTTPNTCRIAAG